MKKLINPMTDERINNMTQSVKFFKSELIKDISKSDFQLKDLYRNTSLNLSDDGQQMIIDKLREVIN